jgi:hypothetical protein
MSPDYFFLKAVTAAVDQIPGIMVALFALFAACLAAAGLYLAGIGAVDGYRGDWGTASFAICIGAFVNYGAYLFARAAWRTRRERRTHPATPAEKTTRRRVVRGYLLFALAQAAFAFALPGSVPGGVRVLSVIGVVLVIPLWLAREFEPPKRTRPGVR